ncbi:hypothetical protein AVT43_gp81 [Polaribacter phage P12002L]|uniref:Uncharacterized protein n=2 Tax=Incheonvirus TaxID=2976977 RepID=A0A0F7ILM7_9CAUD|nr:hypothetical protein AVT42_gp84 [Polaribacter phage P12002S]YP_009209741.1 hypothetical protein AVT43_gp81 [Polaribacter phage P12002L]AKG94255.1 hypothetical protein P12002L_0081 [Polaribacter phage P12002L]AKG94340.1 hypothetical protein P12002S_0084 [Polaribacter phage P12002S]
MKITRELNLTNFEFWSGAKQHYFTFSELQEIQNQLEELYPDGMSETKINDLFWFEEEFLCECICLDFEEYQNR